MRAPAAGRRERLVLDCGIVLVLGRGRRYLDGAVGLDAVVVELLGILSPLALVSLPALQVQIHQHDHEDGGYDAAAGWCQQKNETIAGDVETTNKMEPITMPVVLAELGFSQYWAPREQSSRLKSWLIIMRGGMALRAPIRKLESKNYVSKKREVFQETVAASFPAVVRQARLVHSCGFVVCQTLASRQVRDSGMAMTNECVVKILRAGVSERAAMQV